MKEHTYDSFREDVQPAIQSKLEEFQLLGYGLITEEELWNYLTKKKWKKPNADAAISALVSDILNIKIGDYMNYATVEAFKTGDPFSVLSDSDKKDLLK